MDFHKNARLTFLRREALAQTVLVQGRSLSSAAAVFQVSPKTAAKWVRRYQQEGRDGLSDRSSRPHRSPRRTASEVEQTIALLRRQRWTGCRIAHFIGLSRATVSRILRRLHLNRMRDLEPAPAVLRYEHAAPGDLLHLDIKRLVRIGRIGHRITGDRRSRVKGIGYEFVHVAIDDHSRIAFSQILPDQNRPLRSPSCAPLWLIMRALALLFVVSSPTMDPAMMRSPFARCAASSICSTASLVPIVPKPTAKPSASSRPLFANGPTPMPMRPPHSAPSTCPTGYTSTIGIGRMLV